MNRITTKLRQLAAVTLPAALAALWLAPVAAEAPGADYDERYPATEQGQGYLADDELAAEVVILVPEELEVLVGPIALYPDDLLAIVLPAATYPLDIVEAARFLDAHKKDSSLQPNEQWDESVTALLNYPEVVHLMNDDIDWTWQLGGAVLNQQQDVIEAVESFRDRAYAAGNLKSDNYQTVRNDNETIEILPADEQVIYVPYYEPRQVVVRQVERVYYYYPRPRPVYYYPYPAGHFFFDGYFWGVSTAYRIGWSNHYLNVWHYSFSGHPYYGRYYSARHYRRASLNIYNSRYVYRARSHATYRDRHGDRWRPRAHSARQVRSGPTSPGHRGRPDVARTNAGNLAAQTSRLRQSSARNNLRDRDAAHGTRPNRGEDRDLAARGQHRVPAASNRDAHRPTKPERPRDQIRFRERPNTVTASVPRTPQARSGQRPARVQGLEPREPARASSDRHARDTRTATVDRGTTTRPATTRTQNSTRTAATRTTTRTPAAATRTTTRTPPAARAAPSRTTRDSAAAREPARRQAPATRQERQPDKRVNRDAGEQRQARSDASERKASRPAKESATRGRVKKERH